MARHVFWVSPNHQAGNWHVKHEGTGEKHEFSTKALAEDYAKRWAHANKPSQVKVQLRDGTIETEWTYSNDPVRSPG